MTANSPTCQKMNNYQKNIQLVTCEINSEHKIDQTLEIMTFSTLFRFYRYTVLQFIYLQLFKISQLSINYKYVVLKFSKNLKLLIKTDIKWTEAETVSEMQKLVLETNFTSNLLKITSFSPVVVYFFCSLQICR